jgi:hypothetical protein
MQAEMKGEEKMVKRWILLGLVGLLVLSAVVYAAAGAGLIGAGCEPVSGAMPVPGYEATPEMAVGSEMPVPNGDGVDEMIVGSEMPVPGLEDVEEMIVANE